MNKYNNKKVVYQGITFDSERERDRYLVLKDAEQRGIIQLLTVHPLFELIPPVVDLVTVQLKTKSTKKEKVIQRAITYKADFKYVKDGELIVEDVKISPDLIPKEFAIKEKLMFWRYRIKVKRVYHAGEEI